MKKLMFVALMALMTGCSYSITCIHTQGEATDVVDDPDTTSVTATANIPINPKPGL